MAVLSFLDREHSVAGDNYSRWLVPPAALAIHLSIGQAYAFSVFNLPLSKLVGITESAPDDWKLSTTRLDLQRRDRVPRALGRRRSARGSSASGPRKAMFAVGASASAAAFMVAALGVALAPVLAAVCSATACSAASGSGSATSRRSRRSSSGSPTGPAWRPGMAIMGFGGGAMIASPLSTMLMAHFKTRDVARACAETFVAMGVVYFVFMMFGVFSVRVPPPGLAAGGVDAGRVDAKR